MPQSPPAHTHLHTRISAQGSCVYSVYMCVSQVYLASQRNAEKIVRESWTPFVPTYSGGRADCCNYEYSCPENDRGVGCVPPARAFQSMDPGYFAAGKMSFVMFGGLDRAGNALGDLWYNDIEDRSEGKKFSIVLSNTTVDSFFPAHKMALDHQITVGWGMSDQDPGPTGPGWRPSSCSFKDKISIARNYSAPGAERRLVIEFTTIQHTFDHCLKPVMQTQGALERAVNHTSMQGVQLEVQYQTFEGMVAEYRMPWYKFRSNEWCKSGKCQRALCQSASAQAEKEADSERYLYCYDDADGDGTEEYAWSTGPCGTGFFCAAPGPRHGHATVPVRIQGDTTMLLLVGGESAAWRVNSQSLTMDVHISYFTAAFATWSKVLVSDKNGVACTGDGVKCPQPRRDAAIKMMGNDASSNGRLLMFGGLAAGATMTTSVGRAYLEGATHADILSLSDLWYLDMTPLSVACLSGAEACPNLQWVLIDVPGVKPMGRWGAGMVLDPSDNLYIMGGNTFDTTAREFKVLSDNFIFQLRSACVRRSL